MTDSDTTVPVSHSDITSEWLSCALGLENVELNSTQQIGEEYGLASIVFRCNLVGTGSPESVIVKLWSTDGQGGDREVEFYRKFGADPGLRVPACYFAKLDRELGRGVVVLEDFVEAEQGNCLHCLKLQDSLNLVDAISAFHAKWWQASTLDSADWLPSIPILNRQPDWYEARNERFQEKYGLMIGDQVKALICDPMRLQDKVRERLASGGQTLLHGDLHLDNVLFESVSRQPVILDWARVSKGPAVLDFTEIVFSICEPEDRDQVFQSYLTNLQSHGVEIEREELISQLGGALIHRLIRFTFGIANWEPQRDREREIIKTELSRLDQSLLSWKERDSLLFNC
ncbi:MAG: aminoglycoside phosphotransferase family protein [Fimbriimonadaceae bacterium]|nr:aminoglycoside phosphotransferase family protein [Fimbriimonadaceae bacterium]